MAVRKVVKRKAPAKKPPILMPDLEATLRVPLQPLAPKPLPPRSIVYNKRPPLDREDRGAAAKAAAAAAAVPHGGHVPILVAKAPVMDVIVPPKPGSVEDRKIKAYNQEVEKQRRADLRTQRAARDARKAEVRKMPVEVRRGIGSDHLKEYIRTGQIKPNFIDKVSATVEGAVTGAAKAVAGGPSLIDLARSGTLARIGKGVIDGPSLVEIARSDLMKPGGGLDKKMWDIATGASQVTEGVLADVGSLGGLVGPGATPKQTRLIEKVNDTTLGPDLMKFLAGERYDPKMLLLDVALVPMPLKGAPTGLSALLRSIVGAKRLAEGERAGLTVAQLLARPVKEAKLERALRLRASAVAAMKQEAKTGIPQGPIASSKLAGKVADVVPAALGGPQGKLARVVRNDVRATRSFRVGNDTVETPADLSRLGKGARALIDKARPRRVNVPGLVASEERLGMRALGRQLDQYGNRAAGLEKALSSATGKRLSRVDWPGRYAVRMVGKGITPEEAIRTTEEAIAASRAAGDTLSAEANAVHLGFFKKAAEYVTVDAAGNPVFRPDAPPELEQLRSALERVAGQREDIYTRLDKLSDDVMRGRILKEQLYYANAQVVEPSQRAAAVLEANPIRQKIAAIFNDVRPEAADRSLAILDANAMRVYQAAVEDADAKVRLAEEAIKRNAGAPHLPRLKKDLEAYKAERAALRPDDWYTRSINEVADTLPPDIVERLSRDRGVFGEDWRFSIYDSDDSVRAASQRIADEIIASGLPLPPEWHSPEAVRDGIHEVFRLARDGEYGKDWYKIAAQGVQLVSDATGVPPATVAQLFAIYSQAADTIANSTFVFKAIRQYQKWGDLFVGRFPSRQSEEALSVLKGGKWEGRKRSSFYANILRHIPGQEDEYAKVIAEMAADRGAEVKHPVTVDRWVVRMFNAIGKTKAGKPKDVPGKFYDTFETIMQKMAEHVGWEPEQIQAAAWVTKKAEGFEEEIAKAGGKVKGTLKARLDAGAGDAFESGIARGLAKMDEPLPEVPPQADRLANQANKKWGGFTVGRDLKPVAPRGYSVSMSLTERAFKLHGLKGEDIVKFKEDYAGLLKDRRNKIGGFSDDLNEAGDGTEVTLLSITRNFKDKDEALAFAREQGQETVYEYKTGDGIRTGLTRHEQRAIVDALDDEHLMGGPRGVWRQPTPEEQAYKEFLNRAAIETGHTKPRKNGTYNISESQRNRTEEWLNRNAARYADEPLIQEWYDLTYKQPDDLPWWMLEPTTPEQQQLRASLNESSSLHFDLFGSDGSLAPGGEATLDAQGASLAAGIPGYADAVEALARQEIPTDYITAVARGPLHIYKKLAVGRHLDRLSGGALKGRDFGDPAVNRMFPRMLTLAGLWDGQNKALYWSQESHPVDWIHEFVHALETSDALPPKAKDAIWRHVGATPGEKLSHDQSEDMADIFTSHILWPEGGSTLPDPVKEAFAAARAEARAAQKSGEREFHREEAMLAAFPEEERQFIEDVFRYAVEDEAQFTKGFKPRPGQYLPESPGLPFRASALHPRRTATLWNRLQGGKKITALTDNDKRLTREWKAGLVRSGRYDKDIINGSMEALLKAHQVEKLHVLRDRLLKMGFEQPTGDYGLNEWVMIPVDPKKHVDGTRAKLRSMVEILHAFDTGDTIDAAQLSKVDAAAIDGVKDYLFPGLSDSVDISQFVKDALREPIEGVVWVPKKLINDTGLFDGPIFAGGDSRGWQGLMYGLDTTNNLLKMLTLSLNPAYYPMNMAGQNIMLASQLGFSAPFSLYRSLKMARQMSEEDLALIDRFAGLGFAGAQGLTQHGGLKRFTNAVGHVSQILIDQYPRRFSFMHEARRLGYDTPEKLVRLVNDPANLDDLLRVHTRTQRAMVDYGGLNRFEKGIATHLVFVYPWLRGAGRYTMQFPFDHPLQAAAFAGLVYWQQNRLREALPEGHPGYLKWYLPLNTPTDGENPYGFRLDQLATPLQTLDIAAMMTYWGTGGKAALPWGSNEEPPASMLGPLAEAIEQTIAGYDSFTRQEITTGLPGLFVSILSPSERYASWRKIKKVLDHETHKGLYDTTQTQNWLRLFLGTLAPINVDAGKAADMSAGPGTISPKQSRDKYIAKVEKIGGKPLSDEERATILKWKEADQTYRKVSREYRDEHEIEGDSTIQERTAILLLTVAELRPEVADEARRRADLALQASDDEAQAAYDALRDGLGLSKLATLDGRLRKAQLAARTEGS